MESIIEPHVLHHRTKERIKEFGEVFTPDSYVDDMLHLLARDPNFSWDDESLAFFEPCCGHGNIVISIFSKRLKAIFDKSLAKYSKDQAAYYSVANSINTLWAIDIDAQNIAECRSRVFIKSLEFLKEKLNLTNNKELLNRDKDYMAHLLCAISWHIHENEMLSAMENNKKSCELSARKTRTSAEWLSENKHRPINFHLSWVAYFEQESVKLSLPSLYKRAMKFIEDINGNRCKENIFEFASILSVNNIKLAQKQNDFISSGDLWNRI
ncbi:TPA: hypothetical protein ACPSKE_000100 [Legionella feeleii]